MQHYLEKEVILTNAAIHLATITWEGIEKKPSHPTYALFQRLSSDHSPLRIGNRLAHEVLPRVRSVGFLPPGHAFNLLPIEKSLRVLYCFYEPGFVEEKTGIDQARWERHLGSLVALKNQRLEVLMQEIHAEIEQPGFGQAFLIESITNLMLVELARHFKLLELTSERRHDPQPLAPWQLQRIQTRIEESADKGYPSLKDLAALCNISQSHLARSFKAATGWQIHKYIAEERLQAAKSLLIETDFTCEEIAGRRLQAIEAHRTTVSPSLGLPAASHDP